MKINPPKPIDLWQLQQEMQAAGLPVNALGATGNPATDVYTYGQNGAISELPAGSASVVAAHVPTVPTTAVQPNIPAMIAAVQNSPSLDVTTKANLVSALQGK